MSEGSLPPFKYLDPRRYPARLWEVAGRLTGRLCRRSRSEGSENESEDPGYRGDHAIRESGHFTSPEGREITPDGDEEAIVRHSAENVGEGDRERAAAALREFLAENATNVERAARTRDQAERLEQDGIPSDSAHNRAARAREEVIEALARLRCSLSSSGGTRLARALDAEVTSMDPPIYPEEIRP